MASAVERLEGLLVDGVGLADPRRYGAPPGDALLGAVAVRDTDLPSVPADGPPLALVVTGGAGQLAGPAELCGRRGHDLRSVTVALRDPSGLAANARRVVAAVDDARASGALGEDVTVRVALPAQPPGQDWLAAVDEVAAVELEVELDLAAGVPAAVVAAWIDALLDRETRYAVRTDGTAGSVVSVLAATVAAWDGLGADQVVTLLEHAPPDVPAVDTARRWCRAVVVPDGAATASALRSSLGT